jgi:hypothetical protein
MLTSMSSPYHQPKPTHGVKVFGRPAGSPNRDDKSAAFRLNCILPQNVLNELMRAERETDLYRTRIAANVLCEWAKNKAAGRANSH